MSSFLWGASTAASQVEGDLDNDWTDWADRHAEDWAASADRWGRLKHRERWGMLEPLATDADAYRVRHSIEHEKRFEEDIKLLADHGLNTYRFSFAWSKLQDGPFEPLSSDVVEHYHDVLDVLDEYDIEPILTCWHFTHPKWFHEEGSWRGGDGVAMYEDFVSRLVEEYGDRINYWITLNEPMGWLRWSHLSGAFPPALARLRDVPRVAGALVSAHRRAADVIHEGTDARVGVSIAAGAFEPYNENILNKYIAKALRTVEHGWFVSEIEEWLDWLGVNYYYHYRVDVLGRNLRNRLSWDRSDMRWPLSADGFEYILRDLWRRFELPLIVTEHGLADAADDYRGAYIEDSIEAIGRVRSDGIPVNGYCHWSLLDNIEWAEGRWPQFGLIDVDFETLERTPRESFGTYSDATRSDWVQHW